MNDLTPKLLKTFEKLENLAEIEARLARQEQKARIMLIALMIVAVSALALLLGHIVSPDWLPLGH